MGREAPWNQWRPAYDTKHETELRLSFLLPEAPALAGCSAGGAVRGGRGRGRGAQQHRQARRSRRQLQTIDVTLAQSDAFGETGTTLWLSAQALSCYVLHRIFDRSRHAQPDGGACGSRTGEQSRTLTVVELGAGTGLVSIVCLAAAAHVANARGTRVEVTATDVAAVVDGVLARNLETALRSHGQGARDGATARARVLDWRRLPARPTTPIDAASAMPGTPFNPLPIVDAEAWPSNVDLVLGSDLVYDPASIGPLLDAICHFLRPTSPRPLPQPSRSPTQHGHAQGQAIGGVAVIAQEIRDPAQWAAFLDAARARGFAVVQVPAEEVAAMVERCLPASSRHRPAGDDGGSEAASDDSDPAAEGKDDIDSELDRPFEDVAIIELRYTGVADTCDLRSEVST